MNPYRLILADDHVIFRQGMKRLIEGIEGLEVVGEANDGIELLELLKEVQPDMVILDVSMPNMRGIEAAREIRGLYDKVRILMLTMHNNKEYLFHAISEGAQGYMLKDESDEELLTAIETIRKGSTYVSKHLVGEVAENLSHLLQGKGKLPLEPLTTREREILKLIAEGKANKEISGLLTISVRTVENHRAKILKKLNLQKTADLVKYAIQKGLTELHS